MRNTSELLWELFKKTGNVSHYCLYKNISRVDEDDKKAQRHSDKGD